MLLRRILAACVIGALAAAAPLFAKSDPQLVLSDWPHGSAKLDRFVELTDQMAANGHACLIFSQFTKHLRILEQSLQQRGLDYGYLDGGTSAVTRQELVDQFQKGDFPFFLISLKAGGTGLTLTAADYVIHADPWWNPAVEDQATDRAHRFGQTKHVTIYRLVTRDTVEELILELHQRKRGLAESILAGTGGAGQLDLNELVGLIKDGR